MIRSGPRLAGRAVWSVGSSFRKHTSQSGLFAVVSIPILTASLQLSDINLSAPAAANVDKVDEGKEEEAAAAAAGKVKTLSLYSGDLLTYPLENNYTHLP